MAQRAPSGPSQEVLQLIASSQLGTPTVEYKVGILAKRLMALLYSLLFLAVLSVCSFSISALTNGSLTIVFVGAMVLLIVNLVALLWSLPASLVYRKWRVYLCTNGFVFVKGNKSDVFRWEQIVAVWQNVVNHYRSGNPSTPIRSSHHYTVRRHDGLQVVFDDKFIDVETLGNAISSKVTGYLLPKAIEGYQAGNLVFFGPLNISKQGISNGKETVPWRQMQSIDVIQEKVVIEMSDRRRGWWSSLLVGSVPNASVFTELARFAFNEQRQQLIAEYKRARDNPPQ